MCVYTYMNIHKMYIHVNPINVCLDLWKVNTIRLAVLFPYKMLQKHP